MVKVKFTGVSGLQLLRRAIRVLKSPGGSAIPPKS